MRAFGRDVAVAAADSTTCRLARLAPGLAVPDGLTRATQAATQAVEDASGTGVASDGVRDDVRSFLVGATRAAAVPSPLSRAGRCARVGCIRHSCAGAGRRRAGFCTGTR